MMDERSLPPECTKALEAIERDPLALAQSVEAHLRVCPACKEARVLWLAQEEAPLPLAPAGYFYRLPTRILRKLPRRRPAFRIHHLGWAAAAALLLAVGAGAFLAGRANRTPMVEAKATHDEIQPEAPFDYSEDLAAEDLNQLTPEQMQALRKRLEAQPTH